MERRVYTGALSVSELADYLVDHYSHQEKMQAQIIGERGGASAAVQVGHTDFLKDLKDAVMVAIIPVEGETNAIAVSLGQHPWLTPELATYSAVLGLVAVLGTPLALFGLLWPLSESIGHASLPSDIWETVGAYVAEHGGVLARTEEISHPHATPSV